MGSWLRDHWRAALGAGALLLPVLQGVHALVSLVSDVDFVVSKTSDPGWMASIWSLLLTMPPYVYLVLIPIGLLLIWLDARRIKPSPERNKGTVEDLDRATAESLLTEFASKNRLARPMPGDRAREFDIYIAAYNHSGGSVAFAARQDSARKKPYFYVDQNEALRRPRSKGQTFASWEFERASQEFLRRRKDAYPLGERQP